MIDHNLHPDEKDPRVELRRLLDLAESLQAQYESASRRILLTRLVQLFAISAGIIVGAVVATSRHGSSDWAISIVGALTGFGYAALFEVLVRARAQRRADRERRALEQVVSVIREVEGTVALNEDWSPLERAEFRIRLSRFDA